MQRIWHKVGRRGLVLIFVGILDFVFAANLEINRPRTSVAVYGTILPLNWWVFVWVLAGVVAWVSAFMIVDRIGFGFSALIFSFWGWLSFLAWIRGDQPTAWATATFFLVIAALIVIPATWPEPRLLPSTKIDENYPDAIITADDHGMITGWLGRAEAMFGWTAEEVMGRPITMIMPIKYRHVHDQGIVRVRETGKSELAGKPLRAEGLSKDGQEFPVIVFIGVHHTETGIVFSTTITDMRQVTR